MLLLCRDYIGHQQYKSDNERRFVDSEPVYVPRSTMVDIIYRWEKTYILPLCPVFIKLTRISM